MKSSPISSAVVQKVAQLARLLLTDEQIKELTSKIGITVEYVSQLQTLPTDSVEPTSQVTGTENVFREDAIDTSRMFSQKEALANAKRTYNGFFIVDAVFDE